MFMYLRVSEVAFCKSVLNDRFCSFVQVASNCSFISANRKTLDLHISKNISACNFLKQNKPHILSNPHDPKTNISLAATHRPNSHPQTAQTQRLRAWHD